MQKVPVSRRAIEGRLRRYLLKEDGSMLHKTRGTRWATDLRTYHTVTAQNFIDWAFDDLEQAARETGVLKPFEYLAEEE